MLKFDETVKDLQVDKRYKESVMNPNIENFVRENEKISQEKAN